MIEVNRKGRFIHKHDTEENWLKAINFVPMQAEVIVYDKDENYNYERIKIGDGVTNVNELPFVVDKEQIVRDVIAALPRAEDYTF